MRAMFIELLAAAFVVSTAFGLGWISGRGHEHDICVHAIQQEFNKTVAYAESILDAERGR